MKRLTLIAAIALTGCSQKVNTPAQTDQELATQGTSLTMYIWNTGEPDGGGVTWANAVSSSGVRAFTTSQMTGEDAHAGNIVIANVTVTTGGTTPSATGTTSAQSDTTQDVRPEISGTVPISVAPGGIADSTGTTAGRGSATSSMTRTTEARIANLEAQSASMIDMLRDIMNSSIVITEPE